MSSNSILLKRGVRRGLITLLREKEYATTLGALVGVVLLAQLLLVLVFGIESVHRLLLSQLDLRLQVQEGVTDQEIQEFLVDVRDQPYVRDVTYVTREQAYERERASNPELISFLEEFSIENPFPDVVAVRLDSLQRYDAFADYLQQPGARGIVDPAFLSQATTQEQEVRQMLRLTEAGRGLALGFLALLLCVLTFVVVELTRRRALARQEEIFVERIVGAPNGAVLIPFVTEAAVLLLTSVLLSGLVLWALLGVLPAFVPALADGGVFYPLRLEGMRLLGVALPLVALAELLIVPLLSALGAYLGMRPQMGRGDLSLAAA